jgi:hypothetical protein
MNIHVGKWPEVCRHLDTELKGNISDNFVRVMMGSVVTTEETVHSITCVTFSGVTLWFFDKDATDLADCRGPHDVLQTSMMILIRQGMLDRLPFILKTIDENRYAKGFEDGQEDVRRATRKILGVD